MNKTNNIWLQSIYKTPMLNGAKLAEFAENFRFSMREKNVCLDLVEGPILNEFLMHDEYPYFKINDFLYILRKPVAVEWMDIYFSSAPLAISHKSQYEEILPKTELLIRAVDGGYIYTYTPCMSECARINISNFYVVETVEAPIRDLSFPG